MWSDIFFGYVCPTLGCLMSSAMYAAPVNELRRALLAGKLGSLNPTPWAVMTGWCAYAYYASDPFILASNIPGLLVSIWLNMGAAKLQYLELKQEQDESENGNREEQTQKNEAIIFVSQETILLRLLILWLIALVFVGWLGVVNGRERAVLGILANINVIFFYGAPLQTMRLVIEEGSSASIHVPTMSMNLLNTSFWILYGLAKNDPVIYLPNVIGFGLGMIQGLLCFWYPVRVDPDLDTTPLIGPDIDEDNSESSHSPDDSPGALV